MGIYSSELNKLTIVIVDQGHTAQQDDNAPNKYKKYNVINCKCSHSEEDPTVIEHASDFLLQFITFWWESSEVREREGA